MSTCHLSCSSYVINVFLLSDPDRLRVVFGTCPLEDHRTLGFYNIKHLSVLFIVLKMPGGGGGPGMTYALCSSLQQRQRGAEIPAQDDYMSLSTAAGSLSITDRKHEETHIDTYVHSVHYKQNARRKIHFFIKTLIFDF